MGITSKHSDATLGQFPLTNIFISNFHTCSIGIYDIEGVHLSDLYVNGRPKSISILNDKLLVAVEHGCKILVYDITKT